MYQMDFPNTFLSSDKGQPLNKGQNGQKTMGPKRVRYSEVPLYLFSIYSSTIHCFHAPTNIKKDFKMHTQQNNSWLLATVKKIKIGKEG